MAGGGDTLTMGLMPGVPVLVVGALAYWLVTREWRPQPAHTEP